MIRRGGGIGIVLGAQPTNSQRGNPLGSKPEVLGVCLAYGSVRNICLNWDLENKVKNKKGDIMNSIWCRKWKVGGHRWAGSLPGVVAAGLTFDLACSLHLSSPMCSSHLHLSRGCPTQAGAGTQEWEWKVGREEFVRTKLREWESSMGGHPSFSSGWLDLQFSTECLHNYYDVTH